MKRGRPFTPTTVPASSGTSDRQCVVIAAARMDSFPTALPGKVTANRTTRPFSCREVSVPTNLDYGVGGRGRPACDPKSGASSMNDTCLYPCGRVSSVVSHRSSCSHFSRAGKKSSPHFQSLGSFRQGRSLRFRAGGLQLVPGAFLLLRGYTGKRRFISSSCLIRARSTALNMPCSLCINCSSGLLSSSTHFCPARASSSRCRLAS